MTVAVTSLFWLKFFLMYDTVIMDNLFLKVVKMIAYANVPKAFSTVPVRELRVQAGGSYRDQYLLQTDIFLAYF